EEQERLMQPESRNQRIAASLEQQFQSCHGLLTGTLTQISNQGRADDWVLRNAMSLMKTAAQLAAAIDRIERKLGPKNLENRNSIQQ
ncbi:MAG: hypothetical protein ACJ8IR_14090, partial [Alphaproteobacteria bacterium]